MSKWKISILGILLLICLTWMWMIWMWMASYEAADVSAMPVSCPKSTPLLKSGQEIKVLSWNVQYMAGKNYYFFYELGPDKRPSSEDIARTLKEVARVIRDEDPDIVLLQEVDDGAKRTDYADQLALLLELLPGKYPCHASAFYWKAFFVPHPAIMGQVGMKLSTLSKYKMANALRHQLTLIPTDPFPQQFMLKRAVLSIWLPVKNAKDFMVLNTHLEAFAQGTDTMARQVEQVKLLLEKLDQQGQSWMIGGDFNLLPPGKAYSLLGENLRKSYRKETEIASLIERYQAVPSIEEVNGPEYQKWFTHFPNNPRITKPNKTIDYIFLANDIPVGEHYVRQEDTLHISDHLPVVTIFSILPE